MQYEFREVFEYNGKRYDVKAHTKKELRQKVEARRKQAEREAPALSGRMTVRAWTERAISIYKTGQKEITRKKYINRVNHCILEQIGDMALADVRPIHCQNVLNLQSGNSAAQITEVYNALRFIFRTAEDNDMIVKNPTRGLQKPVGTRTHRRALTDEERNLVRIVAEKKPKYTLYLLMLDCGLRPSEAAEAKGSDIMMLGTTPMLHVRGTKTANADRIVPIPESLYNRIKNTSEDEFIASYESGGKITETNRGRVWQSFRRDMNIELGAKMYRNQLMEDLVAPDLVPYCFRHDYCSRMAKSKIDIRTAQKIMGHSSIELTANIYTHIDEEALLEAARKME